MEMGLKDADVSALAALTLAEEALEALQQQGRGKGSSGAAAGQAILQEHMGAFLARVRFRKALLKVRGTTLLCLTLKQDDLHERVMTTLLKFE